jgi:hypothetical protein
MLSRLFHPHPSLPNGQVARISRRPLFGLAAVVLLGAGSVVTSEAGSTVIPPRTSKAAPSPTPAPTPKYVISSQPHLVAIGPITIDVKPLAGPRVRRPPLLPPPKPIEPDPSVDAANAKPQEPPAPKPPLPSDFSPDAAPTLLPTDKPLPTPAPERKIEPKENALEPVDRGEPDLKDAVMYFETPVGPHGARASIPLAVPYTSPAPAPLPDSRATYRKEKE